MNWECLTSQQYHANDDSLPLLRILENHSVHVRTCTNDTDRSFVSICWVNFDRRLDVLPTISANDRRRVADLAVPIRRPFHVVLRTLRQVFRGRWTSSTKFSVSIVLSLAMEVDCRRNLNYSNHLRQERRTTCSFRSATSVRSSTKKPTEIETEEEDDAVEDPSAFLMGFCFDTDCFPRPWIEYSEAENHQLAVRACSAVRPVEDDHRTDSSLVEDNRSWEACSNIGDPCTDDQLNSYYYYLNHSFQLDCTDWGRVADNPVRLGRWSLLPADTRASPVATHYWNWNPNHPYCWLNSASRHHVDSLVVATIVVDLVAVAVRVVVSLVEAVAVDRQHNHSNHLVYKQQAHSYSSDMDWDIEAVAVLLVEMLNVWVKLVVDEGRIFLMGPRVNRFHFDRELVLRNKVVDMRSYSLLVSGDSSSEHQHLDNEDTEAYIANHPHWSTFYYTCHLKWTKVERKFARSLTMHVALCSQLMINEMFVVQRIQQTKGKGRKTGNEQERREREREGERKRRRRRKEWNLSR